ncbi:MAG TPA: ATP-binding protein, partial [Tepidisphaeraceae bacterium]|nr:ATP-binding protein [Tepidisphaeraceae bacterium]
GLGLAIVQTIAQLHQGKAEIQSQVGSGTRVRLIFPIIPAAETAKEPKVAAEKPFPAEQWAKPAQA